MMSVYDPNGFLALDHEKCRVYINVVVCVYSAAFYIAEFLTNHQVCNYNFVKGQLFNIGNIVSPENYENKAASVFDAHSLVISGMALIIYLIPKLDAWRKQRKQKRTVIPKPHYSVYIVPDDYSQIIPSSTSHDLKNQGYKQPVPIQIVEQSLEYDTNPDSGHVVAGPSNVNALTKVTKNISTVKAPEIMKGVINVLPALDVNILSNIEQEDDINEASVIETNSFAMEPMIRNSIYNIDQLSDKNSANIVEPVNQYTTQMNLINSTALYLMIAGMTITIFLLTDNNLNLLNQLFLTMSHLIPECVPALLILSSEPLNIYCQRQVITYLEEKFSFLNF